MTLTHAQPGQPIDRRASTYSAFVDVANWFRQRAARNDADIPQFITQNPVVIRVKNTTGVALDIFNILELQLDGATIDQATYLDEYLFNETIMNGIVPSSDPTAPIAILLQPAAIDQIVEGLILGIVTCVIDIVDSDHRHATIQANVQRLVSSTSGQAFILDRENDGAVGNTQNCKILVAPSATFDPEQPILLGGTRVPSARAEYVSPDTFTKLGTANVPVLRIDQSTSRTTPTGETAGVYNHRPFVNRGPQFGLKTSGGILAVANDWGNQNQFQNWLPSSAPPSDSPVELLDDYYKMLASDNYDVRDSTNPNLYYSDWAHAAKGSLFLMHHFDVLWWLSVEFRWHPTYFYPSTRTTSVDGDPSHTHTIPIGPFASVSAALVVDHASGESLSNVYAISYQRAAHGHLLQYQSNKATITTSGVYLNSKTVGATYQSTRLDVVVHADIHDEAGSSRVLVTQARLAVIPLFHSTTDISRAACNSYAGSGGTYQWYGDQTEPPAYDEDGVTI